MKLTVYSDAMTITPETAMDQAYLRDTLKIPGEAGAAVAFKRINYPSGEVANLICATPTILATIPASTQPPTTDGEKPATAAEDDDPDALGADILRKTDV